MPLYEYECQNCGRHLEIIQKFSDDPLTECPKCRGAVEKVVSAPAIHFKGSGWYITDYARKDADKKKKQAESSASEKTKKSDSSGEKVEKKPGKSSQKDKDSSQ